MNSVLKRMELLVGDNKPISHVYRSFQFNDEPRFCQFTAFFDDQEDNHGSGMDFDVKTAKIKALGEAIERYCLSSFDKNDFLHTSYSKLDKAISPLRFINYLDVDKMNSENKEKLENMDLNWSLMKDCFSGKDTYLPSQLIYVPYHAKELHLRAPISSGAACASSKDIAIYKGICELIERDAFIIYYCNKLSPKKIEVDKIADSEITSLVDKFRDYFLQINLFVLDTDLDIPTVLCVLTDDSGVGPAVSIGTKTDYDIFTAIKGALLEAQHSRQWIRYLKITTGKKISAPSEIIEIEDRGLFWYDKKMVKELDFIMNTKLVADLSTYSVPKNTLKQLLRTLKEKNYLVYTKNLTTPEIKELGFCVYKTIVPDLQPIYLFEDSKYVFGKRLSNIPVYLNQKPIVNKTPHPFV